MHTRHAFASTAGELLPPFISYPGISTAANSDQITRLSRQRNNGVGMVHLLPYIISDSGWMEQANF